MSRFFKSALFPIVIVIVLALFASRLIDPGTTEQVPTYSEFLTQAQDGEVESVTINTKDNSIEVVPKSTDPNVKPYETAYPDNTEQSLVNTLAAENIPIEVKKKDGGGICRSDLRLPLLIFLFF